MRRRSDAQGELERFANKYVPEPNTGCWLWTGATHDKGYGVTWYAGKLRRAHRVSYELHTAEIPEGLNVCHKCDTTACVNPEHLFLGTQAENIHMMSKGRARGPRFGGKLTAEDVIRVRALRGVVTQRSLARELGVGRWAIADAQHGVSWRHV